MSSSLPFPSFHFPYREWRTDPSVSSGVSNHLYRVPERCTKDHGKHPPVLGHFERKEPVFDLDLEDEGSQEAYLSSQESEAISESSYRSDGQS